MLSDLIASTRTWAAATATAGGVSEWQKAITGQSSRADLFAVQVRTYISFFDDGSMSVEPLKVNFGVHGELPILAVQLGDCFVLIDAIQGFVSGPFAPGQPLNATGLLNSYPTAYAPNTGLRYVTATGCPVTVAASWTPGLPPGATPRGANPNASNPSCVAAPPFPIAPPLTGCAPGTVPVDPTSPGWPTPFSCNGPATPAVPFRCDSYEMYIGPDGKVIWVRQQQLCPAGTLSPPAGCFAPSPSYYR